MPPTKSGTRPSSKRRGPAKITAAHKEALALGREQSRHVGAYLDALAANKPKRGRKRTSETIRKQLADVESRLPAATGLKRLELAQAKIDLRRELETVGEKVDLSHLRKNFLKQAKSYGERKGLSYQAWREAGVPVQDLRDAGITRGSR
jgi:hypothetical protein